jgi:hypothetical protein
VTQIYFDPINGYVIEFWKGQHPLFPGMYAVRRARRKIAEKLGRPLNSNEVVHHKNKKRDDDRLRNLQLMTVAGHLRHHHIGRKVSPEIRMKMSASARALLTPAERKRRSRRAKAQHAIGKLGQKTWRTGTAEKVAAKLRGRPSKLKGIKRPKAIRLKISQGLKGKPKTPEHIAAVVAAHLKNGGWKSRPHTEDTKRKIARSMRRYRRRTK